MPSVQAKMLNKIFQSMPKDAPGTKHDYFAERAQNERRPVPKVPRGVSLEETTFDGIPGEVIYPSDQKEWEKDSVPVIWYIHGGGFTTGSAKESRGFTQYLVSEFKLPCISTDYRRSPENKWPAQLDDCMKVYDAVTARGIDAGRLILVGSSAGGTLVLSLALRLAMEGKAQPMSVIALSAWTDQTVSLPSHKTNISTDYMLGDALAHNDQFEAVFGFEDGPAGHEEFLKDPLISPYYGDYSRVAPVFLAASDAEFLYDDSRLLYERLKAEGHDVELDIQHDVCHAYASLPMMPEAKETLKKAMAFAVRTKN